MLKILISCVRSVICSEEFEFDVNIDFKKLYEVAVKHKIEVLVGYALLPHKTKMQPEDWDLFEKSMFLAAIDGAKMDFAVNELDRAFAEHNITYMYLKGYVIRKMYPSNDMRSMGDIDILIKREQVELVQNITSQLGYTLISENIREFNCIKKILLEFHLDMISFKYKVFHDYYDTIWDKAFKKQQNSYELTDEDYFIYHIVHMSKHYKGGGTGIRSFVDVFIFLKNKEKTLNWDYVNDEFEKIGLKDFCQSVVELSDMWFANGKVSKKLEEMAEYVFESGVYGSLEHVAEFRSVQTMQYGKYKTMKNMIFPDMHVMSTTYPILIKYKVLLPFCWIARLIRKALKGEYSVALKKIFKRSDMSKRISDHFNDVGL